MWPPQQFFYHISCQGIHNYDYLRDDDKFKKILVSANSSVIFSAGVFMHGGYKSRALGKGISHQCNDTNLSM